MEKRKNNIEDGVADINVSNDIISRNACGRFTDKGKSRKILVEIRNSTFISALQLTVLLNEDNVGSTLRSLKQRKYIFSHDLAKIRDYSHVYSITREGLAYLETIGLGLLSITSETDNITPERQVYHYLALNNIRIFYKIAFNVDLWYTDRQTKSINLSLPMPFAKDYDSICVINNKNIAIEYEQMLKSADKYTRIADSLKDESSIAILHYYVNGLNMVYPIHKHYKALHVPIIYTDINELVPGQSKDLSVVYLTPDNTVVKVNLKDFYKSRKIL